ncbi:MAG: hypothetical protein HQ567_32705 [Candidatus Nealsonbacteria bacterium]|nr:hypothetical protein [Candidatus Nealsonbacteria bacterium]
MKTILLADKSGHPVATLIPQCSERFGRAFVKEFCDLLPHNRLASAGFRVLDVMCLDGQEGRAVA